TSTNEFYTYALGTSSTYELTSYFESDKYQQTAANSGNPDPTTYAIGSNLSITPFIHGLVGYWSFNDASGGLNSNTADSSGWGNYGTLQDSTSTGTGPTYQSSGCISGGCLSYDGVDDHVVLNNISTVLEPIASGISSPSFSLAAWVNPQTGCLYQQFILSKSGYHQGLNGGSCTTMGYMLWNSSDVAKGINGPTLTTGMWHLLVGTWNSTNGLMNYYVDGVSVGTNTQTSLRSYGTNPFYIGGVGYAPSTDFASKGIVDDVYVYSVALSAAQVKAMYNAGNP
ncbi:MAG: LamG domain-containing protein, partial [Patescibacteria group bacterium]|nr:LamG domain-containing protein [Patescibacteria group bacterium]